MDEWAAAGKDLTRGPGWSRIDTYSRELYVLAALRIHNLIHAPQKIIPRAIHYVYVCEPRRGMCPRGLCIRAETACGENFSREPSRRKGARVLRVFDPRWRDNATITIQLPRRNRWMLDRRDPAFSNKLRTCGVRGYTWERGNVAGCRSLFTFTQFIRLRCWGIFYACASIRNDSELYWIFFLFYSGKERCRMKKAF